MYVAESLVVFSTEDEDEKSEASRYLSEYNDIFLWKVVREPLSPHLL